MCLPWVQYFYSHVVVEKLLKLLVDKVDGNLLKAVVLKDLKTSNVEHGTEVGFFMVGSENCEEKNIFLLTLPPALMTTYQSGCRYI